MSNEPHVDRVKVEDERGNIIWLRRKMGWGIRNKVISAASHLQAGQSNVDIDVGAYNTALLLHNILAWSGPDLDGKVISVEALDDLDQVLGDQALERIGTLNAPRSEADEKKSTSSTGRGSGAPKA